MDPTFKNRCLNTVGLIILILGHLEKARSASNLKVNGNEVSGKSFHLECFTRTINTLNYASFFRSTNTVQSGTRVGYREFYPNRTPLCRERTNLVTNYTVSCNSDGSMFSLTIPGTNTIEHRTYWRCQTDTDNIVMDNNVIHLLIIVNVNRISWVSPVVGPDNTVNVTSDKPTTFQCQTTQGRPEANITWYLDNVQLSGGTTTTTPVSGDIVITTGSLTLTVNRKADDKALSCRATNYVNMEPVESTVTPVIRVKYAPSGPPIIVRYNDGTIYKTRIGRPQSVTCQVPTAYPVPILSWSCPSYIVTGTTTLPGWSTDVVSSSITWTATSTELGQTCQCTSYQEVSGTVTTYISIDVLYLPDITGYADRDVVEYQTSTISCTADGVPATYTFYNWSHVAPDSVTVLRSLPGTYNSTTTTLILSDVNYQDTGYYRCSVSNGIRHYITGEIISTTNVVFTVKSGPVTEPLGDVTGRKNGSSTLNVKFYSNDDTVPHVTWRKSSRETALNITDTRFESSVNAISSVTLTMYGHSIINQPGFIVRLTVHNITQEDFTIYSCQISNTIGSTTVFLALKLEDIPAVSTPSIGPAIGGTIGGLLGVVLVSLIVYLLKRRGLDKSSDTSMRNTAADGNRVYDTLQTTSPEASPYQTLELHDSSSSGIYVNLEL